VTSTDGGTVFAEGRRVNVRLDPVTMRPVPWTEPGRAIGAVLLRG
jgi:acyl-CoA thioester hydrolase